MPKSNEPTKKELYALLLELVKAQENINYKDNLIARLEKDIEIASKPSSKKETEKDKQNNAIQDAILDILEGGDMVYKDFIKAVQARFLNDDLSPQKITANVTKLGKDFIKRYEAGKGKEKKLYIGLVPAETSTAPEGGEGVTPEDNAVTE